MNALVQVENLSIRAGELVLVDDLSLRAGAGEALTILGETGAGKSILAQAILGLLPEGLEARGSIVLAGQSLSGLEQRALQSLWGRRVTMLPQEPWHSLDPLMKGWRQVGEVHECVGGAPPPQARRQAQADLRRVGLGDAGDKLPGQLSGGMAQRLAFCAATAAGAEIVLADEPTKGLDASKRDAIIALLKDKAREGCVVSITHDIEVARQMGGKLIVMRQGKVVERGETAAILAAPASDYARQLIGAAPANWPIGVPPVPSGEVPVVQARGLGITRGGKLLFSGLDLDLLPGEIVGITGDSGCGKSSLGDILLGLLEPDEGSVSRVGGERGKYLKLYQDPPAAFALNVPLGRLFDDLMALHRIEADILPSLLAQLRLPASLLQRTAREVSGGELQRLAIARALMLKPLFLFADEPVSRLDPITAKEILFLLAGLSQEFRCGLLLVSHDPEVVRKLCRRSIALGDFGGRASPTNTKIRSPTTAAE